MKKVVLAFLLAGVFGSAAPVAAQTVWAPAGAEWWYDAQAIGGPGYVHARADQLVMWQGQSCRRIVTEYYILQVGTTHYVATGTDTLYTTQAGNEVKIWTGQQFERLFDMSWVINDSWTLNTYQNCSGNNDTARVVVDSLGLRQIGSRTLEFRRTKTLLGFTPPLGLNPFGESEGMVTERLGYPNAVIRPQLRCGTDPVYYRLIYYTDSDLSFGTRPSLVTAASDDITRAIMTISPNPSANGRYQIEGIGAVRCEVFDAQGRRVLEGRLTGDTALDLSAQPTGLYVVRLSDEAGRSVSRRLVRE